MDFPGDSAGIRRARWRNGSWLFRAFPGDTCLQNPPLSALPRPISPHQTRNSTSSRGSCSARWSSCGTAILPCGCRADLVGVSGKIADVFNDVATVNQRRAAETARVCRMVGKEGKLKERMVVPGAIGGRADEVMAHQHAHRRPRLADDRGDARGRRGRQRRPRPVDEPRGGRPAARRRVPAVGQAGQHDDRPALGVHVGGHARRARSRHRRQARRSGAGARRVGRLEGTHRVGQPDGRQPHGAGPQHRRRDDRGRERRPVQEDHRRRPRRDPAAQGSHQHDGGPAAVVRAPK